jgi:phosphoglycerol transferase MdoB-like AlkP superfamily enzyme
MVLLLFRSMLIQQPFTEKFRLPDVPLTTPEIITIVVYGIALVLLIQFAQIVWSLWPRAFPQMAPLAPALAALVYVLVLGAVYTAVERPILVWAQDPNLLLAVQGVALLIAIGLLVWAGAAIYAFVPAWINSLRFETSPVSSGGTPAQS